MKHNVSKDTYRKFLSSYVSPFKKLTTLLSEIDINTNKGMLKDIADMNIPIGLVRGEKDEITPSTQLVDWEEILGDSLYTTYVSPHAGHAVYVDDYTGTNKILDQLWQYSSEIKDKRV